MAKLPLALDITDVVSRPAGDPGALDIDAIAAGLVEAHPEAGATRDEVLDVLIEEATLTGLIPPKPSEV